MIGFQDFYALPYCILFTIIFIGKGCEFGKYLIAFSYLISSITFLCIIKFYGKLDLSSFVFRV